MAKRVLVVGLDCAPPSLVFGRYRDAMPRLSALMERGTWAPLRSTVPPITVPAWTSMLSGRDPGELGLYGFRNRKPGSYELRVASAEDVRVPRVWDYLGEAGKRVSVLFVPPTYPPPRVNGTLVSCFLTPDTERTHTHPPQLGTELARRFGPYRMDVQDFRTRPRGALLRDLYAMTEQHFAIAEHLWRAERPDFMVMVEMGPDRLHHAFWSDLDESHPLHDPDSSFSSAGRSYYGFLDQQLGRLLDALDDDTAVLVVSDHGARPLEAGLCLNEWLRDEGYLVLQRPLSSVTPAAELPIDWSRTRAWGEGGYYGRVFLNIAGREPAGAVPASGREVLAAELAQRLSALPGHDGRPARHRVLRPEHSYRQQRGQPPDLCAFFGDLRYRAIGSIGHGQLYLPGTDQGSDSCNHDWDGIFVMAGADTPRAGQAERYAIYDVATTVLGLLGVAGPEDLLGIDRSRHP